MNKINLISVIIVVVLLSLLVSAINLTSISQNNIPNISINNTHKLAKVFNEDNLDFDRELRKEYLDWHKNFSDLAFDTIVGNSYFIVKVGARNENLKGIKINNDNYAFHLIYCDSYNRYCIFKINGIPTKRLFSFKDFGNTRRNSFDFDVNYTIKINSIQFDFCDNRRFCHLGYEGYHVVNVSIERK